MRFLAMSLRERLSDQQSAFFTIFFIKNSAVFYKMESLIGINYYVNTF